MTRPRVLIEDWLPIEAIGVESKRERGASSALPPLYFLHVWWARRPLTTSRAAILGGVLPAWSPEWPEHLRQRFPDQESYHTWFVHLCGIRGDPVAGRKLVDWAKAKGVQLDFNPYGGTPRAFTVNPAPEDLALLGDLLEQTWGTRDLSVLDPFAGGGSIPFEALRYGFTTYANDLNPVAAVILKATLEYPARFGPALADDIRQWGKLWAQRVEERLAPYFPKRPGESIFAYLWARTVACPTTGKPVPLSPNWWLRRGDDPVAVQLIAEPHMAAPEFRIVRGDAVRRIDPDQGTVNRGNARSPWTGEVIDGDYIKAEAQAGRMGEILYAVVLKETGGFSFRAPSIDDATSIRASGQTLLENRQSWLRNNVIPTEAFPTGNDNRPLLYGMPTWSDFFSPRQLLAMGIMSDTFDDIEEELREALADKKRIEAITTYLAFMMDKMVIYNNRGCRFDPRRGIRSNFDRHDYAFVASHAEFDAAGNLIPWAIGQITDAYYELAKLSSPEQASLNTGNGLSKVELAQISKGSASRLLLLQDEKIHNITVDPPYYDNVQYAELADFFYVWLKRSVGHLFPDLFTDELTNKDDEAVANPARFASLGKKKRDLAEQDYERKMAAAFREMHRVLRDDGVLTVMFTHKRVEAWDTLASALIGAGFTIHASWPVHTESEHSLHQAKKNAAASTILLVCRKRESEVLRSWGSGVGSPQDPTTATPQDLTTSPTQAPIWWDDIKGRVRRVAREKAQQYAQQGITGVDLYISTFGPTLSVISEQWPVLTSEVAPRSGEPIPLRPEIALDLAREEVIRLRKEGLLAGRAITFDAVTDWYLMAWDAFQAEEFPFDEARKLALALGLEMADLLGPLKLVAKKSQSVVLQRPEQRRKKGMVDPDAALFAHTIDAVHTAMLLYTEDGAGACDVFLQNRGLKRDATFKAVLQALINAIPRTRIKGKFVRPETDILDRMRLAFYADELTAPPEEEPPLSAPRQGGLFDDAAQDENFDGEETDEEEDA